MGLKYAVNISNINIEIHISMARELSKKLVMFGGVWDKHYDPIWSVASGVAYISSLRNVSSCLIHMLSNGRSRAQAYND